MLSAESGTMQVRIREDSSSDARKYIYYSTEDLERDLCRLPSGSGTVKSVTTSSYVRTVSAGEIVISLISRIAAIVQPEREGHLLTQNFAVIKPDDRIDPVYLVYLLNEDPYVRRQFLSERASQVVKRINVSLLEEIKLPPLPQLEKQRLIGELYLNVKKLAFLQKEKARLQETAYLEEIRRVLSDD